MSAPQASVQSRSESLRRVLTTAAARTWEFSIWEDQPDGEPRIRDTEAAERLGFARPRSIRDLIKRIWPESQRPHCRSSVSRQSTGNGASREYTVNEFWLTEAQLLKVVARSETAIAEEILDEMIQVYMAVRRHLATAVPVEAHTRKLPKSKPPVALGEPRKGTVIEVQIDTNLEYGLRRWSHAQGFDCETPGALSGAALGWLHIMSTMMLAFVPPTDSRRTLPAAR